MSDVRDDKLGLTIDRETGDTGASLDNNQQNKYLHQLADIFMTRFALSGLIICDPENCVIDETTARIQVPAPDNPIIGLIDGKFFEMTSSMEASGTATSDGTTTTLIDASLGGDDGFWEDAFIIFTSGANDGEVRRVTGWNATLGRLTWDTALPAATSVGDTYIVTFYYIQNKTNGAVNYVYGRTLTRTTWDAVIQWIANTTGIKNPGDILVATMTLDGSGNVTAVSYTPTGHDRLLYRGVGVVDTITLTGTLEGLDGGATTEVTRSHDALVLLGPIEVSVDNPNCEATVVDGVSPSSCKIQVTNNSAYPVDVNYTITRKGRLERLS